MCQQAVPGSRNTFLRTPGTRRGLGPVKRRKRRASIASAKSDNPLFQDLGFTVEDFDDADRPIFGERLCKGFYLTNGECVDTCPDTSPFVDRFRRCKPPGAKQVAIEAISPLFRGLVESLTPELVFTFPWHASEAWVYIAPRKPRQLFPLRFFGAGVPELQKSAAEKAHEAANGPIYLKHSRGTCQGTGYEFIESEAECTAAGAKLGLTKSAARSGSTFAEDNTRPHGCYIYFGTLYSNPYGTTSSTDRSRLSLCCQRCRGDVKDAPPDPRVGKMHTGAADAGEAAFQVFYSQRPISNRFTDVENSKLVAMCRAECVARRPIRDDVWSDTVAHAIGKNTFDAYLGECTGVQFEVFPAPVKHVTAQTLQFAGVEVALNHPLQPIAGVAKAGRQTGLVLRQATSASAAINLTLSSELVYLAPQDGGCRAENYASAGDLTGKIVVVEDTSEKRICPIYVSSAAGGCTGETRAPITTEEECDAAASCLRIPPTKVHGTVNQTEAPAGCFFEPGRMDVIGRNSLFFNTGGSPTTSTAIRLALCKIQRLTNSCDDATRVKHVVSKGAAAVLIALNSPHQVYIGADGFPFSNNAHGTEYGRVFGWSTKARAEWMRLRYTGEPNAAASSDPDPYAAQAECTHPLRLAHDLVAKGKYCRYAPPPPRYFLFSYHISVCMR